MALLKSIYVRIPEFMDSTQHCIVEQGITYTVERAKHGEFWFKYNTYFLHRMGKPAVIYNNGAQVWMVNNQTHRLHGPAVDCPGDIQEWYFHGKRHRTDGPARVWVSGNQEWWYHGKLHRLDGPARITNQTQMWYYHNTYVPVNSQEQFERWLKLLVF